MTLPAKSGRRDRTWETRRLGEHLLLSEQDIELLNALKPRCARCNKRVDQMFWGRKSISSPQITFVVSCHGETEETVIAIDDFPELMTGGVQGGVAFKDKAV